MWHVRTRPWCLLLRVYLKSLILTWDKPGTFQLEWGHFYPNPDICPSFWPKLPVPTGVSASQDPTSVRKTTTKIALCVILDLSASFAVSGHLGASFCTLGPGCSANQMSQKSCYHWRGVCSGLQLLTVIFHAYLKPEKEDLWFLLHKGHLDWGLVRSFCHSPWATDRCW
jgi:hypothetical protein